MAKKHLNDVPGDIAGEDAENLPGGFGSYNPDLNPDALVDDVTENDAIGANGTMFAPTDQFGGDTAGTNYVDIVDLGSTVDPKDLLSESPAAAITPKRKRAA